MLTWEGVRGERFVYARYFDQQPVVEYLHDLKTDPDQLINLVTDKKQAQTLKEMRSRCDDGWENRNRHKNHASIRCWLSDQGRHFRRWGDEVKAV